MRKCEMQYRSIGEEKSKSLFIFLQPDVMNMLIAEMKTYFSEDLSERDIRETLEAMLTIDLTSYKDYKESTVTGWKEKFYDTEQIFNMFTDKDRVKLAKTIILCHYAINDTMNKLSEAADQSKALHVLNSYVSNEIMYLDTEIGLYNKIFEYIKLLNPPVLEEFGKREQDSPEYSFNKEEVRLVESILVVSKIFLPLYAIMLKKSKEAGNEHPLYDAVNKRRPKLIDKKIKERYCFSFIEPLVMKHIPQIYAKLLGYIEKFIEIALGRSGKMSASQVFRNNSLEELVKTMIAYMMCRRCVKHDLSSPTTNIMGIIWQGAKKADQMASNTDFAYFTRILYDTGEADSTKESHLELNSGKSRFTGDEELYIELIVLCIIEDKLEEYGISEEFFNMVFNFNLEAKKTTEIFIETMLNSAYHDYFESCNGVKTLMYIDLIRLITLTQIICAKKGWIHIAHRITSLPVMQDDKMVMRDQVGDIYGNQLRYNTGSFAAPLLEQLIDCHTKVINDQKKSSSIYTEAGKLLDSIAKYFTDFKTVVRTHEELIKTYSNSDVSINGQEYVVTMELMKEFCLLLEGV